MNCLNVKVRLIACFAVVCFFAGMNTPVANAQKPKSGAMLKIDGTVGTTQVHLTIYDSQIHSGLVQAPPCDPNFPTDAYVLQGGSWTGCDPGDAYEITDNNNSGFHQAPGIANLAGSGYSFHIETHYTLGGCNTSGSICGSPDSGFLTVTNNNAGAFVGTITLQGTPQNRGDANNAASFCPVDVHGNAIDSVTTTAETPLANGGSVTLGLGFPSGEGATAADSSNCGGFNAPQTTAPLTQGQTTKVQIGGDDFEITPFLGGTGDVLTVLPIPVPAGPISGSMFGPTETVLFPSVTGSRFSATNFPGQASIPIADLSAVGNPVALEFQVTCTPGELNDCSSFIYTAQTDFTIDPSSFPGGVGGPHFLGQHDGTPVGYDGTCPTTGFTVDIFLSYTGGIGDPPLLGSSDGWSCFVGTFDPNAAGVPAGAVVKQKTLVGFQAPVSDAPAVNVIKAGSTVPLKWQTLDGSGNPVTTLTLCSNFGGAGCTAPWVFIGTTAINCTTDAITGNTDIATNTAGGSGLQNLGNGNYQYNWQTVKGSTGCVTPVLKFSTGFVSFSVANFQYK